MDTQLKPTEASTADFFTAAECQSQEVLRLRGGGSGDEDEEESGEKTKPGNDQKDDQGEGKVETQDDEASQRQRRKIRKPRLDDFVTVFDDTVEKMEEWMVDSDTEGGPEWKPPVKKTKIYEEEDEDSDYDSDEERRRNKNKSKWGTSTPERAEGLAQAFSPEIQNMMEKMGVKTADPSKNKQKLDQLAASLAIHRWARKIGVDLLQRSLSRQDYESVLQNYGREGSKLILSSTATLKKCWESTYCSSNSKIHQKCQLCDEAMWENLDVQENQMEDSEPARIDIVVQENQMEDYNVEIVVQENQMDSEPANVTVVIDNQDSVDEQRIETTVRIFTF